MLGIREDVGGITAFGKNSERPSLKPSASFVPGLPTNHTVLSRG